MPTTVALLGDIPSGLGDALSITIGLAAFAAFWFVVWALEHV